MENWITWIVIILLLLGVGSCTKHCGYGDSTSISTTSTKIIEETPKQTQQTKTETKPITKAPPKKAPKPVTKSIPATKPKVTTTKPVTTTSQGNDDSTFGRENVNTDRKNEKRYVAGSNTNKFHNTDCHHAKKIEPGTEIYFSSREDAIRRGFVPCKVCNP